MGHRDDYDDRYVDHGADDCMDRAGGMDRYHDYEYYAQERAYSNQTGDYYDKSQEYESYQRQQEQSAAQSAYEQYLHLKRLGIDDRAYGYSETEDSFQAEESVISYTSAIPMSKKQRRKLMEEEVAINFVKGRKEARKKEERRKLMEVLATGSFTMGKEEVLSKKRFAGCLVHVLILIGLTPLLLILLVSIID